MKKLKKIIVLMSAFLITANLTACNSGNSTSSTGEAGKTINIEVPWSDRYLETAARKFEEANKGVKINIKEYVVDAGNEEDQGKFDEGIEKAEYSINTGLMAGKGPDIILSFPQLQYKKYIDMDMFEDMNEFIKNDKNFNKDDYYSNIFKAIEYNEGLYTLPLGVSFPLMTGNKSLFKEDSKVLNDKSFTWDEFYDIGRKSNEGYLIRYLNKSRAFYDMFDSYGYDSFINKDTNTSNFKSEKFVNLLEETKKLIDDKVIFIGSSDARDDIPFDHKLEGHDISSIMNLLLYDYEGNPSKDNTYVYKYPTLNKENYFHDIYTASINKNSKNKDLAWKFTKFLISEEVQNSPEAAGFPVNKNAFKKRAETERSLYVKSAEENGEDKDKINKTFDETIVFAEKLMSSASDYNHIDERVTNIILEHVDKFFSGEKSAEEVAEVIQNKVTTYLKEQN